MSTLDDHLTKESVQRLHEAFMEGVLELDRTKAGDIGLNKHTFQEVGVPIVRYVHSRLWQEARQNNTGQLVDFPRVTGREGDDRASVNAILESEGVSHSKKSYSSTKLAADVARIMQAAGIAVFRRPRWFLKPFDESRVEWITHDQYSQKTDPRVEKRIEEHADSPVNSKIDLRSIARPKDFTPDEVAKFIERFVPAALKVQDALEEHLAHHAEEEEAKAWEGVGDALSKALGES